MILAPAKQAAIIGLLDSDGIHTSEINRWPATMLAAKRTDKVIGRIKTLTNSITTISAISPNGVPKGTK